MELDETRFLLSHPHMFQMTRQEVPPRHAKKSESLTTDPLDLTAKLSLRDNIYLELTFCIVYIGLNE